MGRGLLAKVFLVVAACVLLLAKQLPLLELRGKDLPAQSPPTTLRTATLRPETLRRAFELLPAAFQPAPHRLSYLLPELDESEAEGAPTAAAIANVPSPPRDGHAPDAEDSHTPDTANRDGATASTSEGATASNSDTGTRWCKKAAARYGVLSHITWGTLTATHQERWNHLHCDLRLRVDRRPSDATVNVMAASSRLAAGGELVAPNLGAVGLQKIVRSKRGSSLEPGSIEASAWCLKAYEKYHVLVGTSWGLLPQSKQEKWNRLECNSAPFRQRQQELERDFIRGYSATMAANVAARPPSRRLRRAVLPSSTPSTARRSVVAVCVSSTSRGTNAQELGDLALFAFMLPTLRDSIRIEAASGLDFWVYITFDVGDAFFESREAQISTWIEREICAPLAKVGVHLNSNLLVYNNTMRKPGPAFNFMLASAFADGADYFYRVNDDTKFVEPWASQAVELLAKLEPPNLGVVGPFCAEGNTQILTHDLTHRTHLDIFEHYYPPLFSDWWMDDWITKVYDNRTVRAEFTVQHLIGHQGTRYEVNRAHELGLARELQHGRERIRAWKARHE